MNEAISKLTAEYRGTPMAENEPKDRKDSTLEVFIKRNVELNDDLFNLNIQLSDICEKLGVTETVDAKEPESESKRSDLLSHMNQNLRRLSRLLTDYRTKLNWLSSGI